MNSDRKKTSEQDNHKKLPEQNNHQVPENLENTALSSDDLDSVVGGGSLRARPREREGEIHYWLDRGTVRDGEI